MVERTALGKLIFVGILSLIPLFVAACAQSVGTQSERDKAQQVTGGGSGVTTLIGAQKLAPLPPPVPSATPPPKRTTPASYYEPVGPFFFYVETLTSANTTKYGVAATTPCVQSGVFTRGMRLVFRFEILDTSTGKRVTDK